MKRVLVTGGLGFVGSHLTDRLLTDGCAVTIVDNLSSNVMAPTDYPGCQVLLGAIEDVYPDLLQRCEPFDEIYHLASVVGPAGVLQHSGTMARSIVMSGEAVIQIALQHGARLLLASTSEVYGRAGKLRECDGCQVSADVTVRLEYAVAKLASEVAALNRAKVTDLQVNVVRPFNIAGPRQLPDGGFVLPRFVVAALSGEALTVFGDGSQVRAFTDVRDIVSGLRAVMASNRNDLVLNLGNPANEVTILDLAQRVKRLAQSSSPISMADPKELFGPLYEEGIERVPVVGEAFSALNWRPEVSVDHTILSTIEWYRERLSQPQPVNVSAAA